MSYDKEHLADDNTEYLAQVNDDIREVAPEAIHVALREPANLERWILALKDMKRSTESQLAAKKAEAAENRAAYANNKTNWLAYASKAERARSDIIRFKCGVESKLDEATMLRDSEINTLLAAIEQHQHDMNVPGADAFAVDSALYAVLGYLS